MLTLVGERLDHHLRLVCSLHDASFEGVAAFDLEPHLLLRDGQEVTDERGLERVERLGHRGGLVGHRHIARPCFCRIVDERHAEDAFAVDRCALGPECVDEEHREEGDAEAVIGERLTRPHAPEEPAGARQICERVDAEHGFENAIGAFGHGSSLRCSRREVT